MKIGRICVFGRVFLSILSVSARVFIQCVVVALGLVCPLRFFLCFCVLGFIHIFGEIPSFLEGIMPHFPLLERAMLENNNL